MPIVRLKPRGGGETDGKHRNSSGNSGGGGSGGVSAEVDWAGGIRSAWQFGEAGARLSLDQFMEHGVYHFESSDDRFRADKLHTAAISPYIRFGELSVRRVYQRVREERGLKFARTFVRRLVWRDLAYWFLWRFPTLPDNPFRPCAGHAPY